MFPMRFVDDFTVLRAGEKQDPYNPAARVEDWTQPTRRTVSGFLAQTGSAEQPDGNRVQLTDTAVLTIPAPDADIQRGDQVLDTMGRRWYVEGHPARNTSPFTGWKPTTVCQLKAWQG